MKRLVLALAISGAPIPWVCPSNLPQESDPHKPYPRSKGEKARNKKYRRR